MIISGNGKMEESDEYGWWQYGSEIKKIALQTGLTSIGEEAFMSLNTQSSITIPKTVIKIGAYAFSYTDFKSVTIPTSVTSIGEYAFDGAPLKTINYKGTKAQWDKIKIGEGAFADGTKINFSSGSSEIYNGSGGIIGSCGENLTYSIKDGTLTISGTGDMYEYDLYNNPDWLIKYVDSVNKIVFEEGITSISGYSFVGMKMQPELIIPNSVKKIGDFAFYECNMESLTIPVSVTEIGSCAFYCSTLKNVSYEGTKDQWAKINIGSYPFHDDTKIYSLGGSSSKNPSDSGITGSCGKNLTYSIKDGTLTISGTGDMYEYNLYNNPDWLIKYADSINKIVFEEGITSISGYSFVGMKMQPELIIPNSVKKIGDFAFYKCNIESLYIPISVTEMGICAFYCPSLKNVTYEGTQELWDKYNYDQAFNALGETEKTDDQNNVLTRSGDEAFIDGDMIYFNGYPTNSIFVYNGNNVNEYPVGGYPENLLAKDGKVWFSIDGTVYSLDTKTGEKSILIATLQVVMEISYYNGTVYVLGRDGTGSISLNPVLYSIDPETGKTNKIHEENCYVRANAWRLAEMYPVFYNRPV